MMVLSPTSRSAWSSASAVARAPEDGREVHAQELCAGGGDEARDGGRRRLREARLHRLQRVRYEAPLEDREHGSPEPHEAGLRDRRALARRVPKGFLAWRL